MCRVKRIVIDEADNARARARVLGGRLSCSYGACSGGSWPERPGGGPRCTGARGLEEEGGSQGRGPSPPRGILSVSHLVPHKHCMSPIFLHIAGLSKKVDVVGDDDLVHEGVEVVEGGVVG